MTKPQNRGFAISPRRVTKAYFIALFIENFVFSLDELQQEDVEQQLAVAELSDERENLGLTISSSLSKIFVRIPAITAMTIEVKTL